MSEEDKKEKTLPNMKVLAQFIRDLSFENILAQKGLDSNSPPDVSVKVNLDAKKRKTENHYEVLIKLSIESSAKEPSTEDESSKLFVKQEGSKLFILEIEYGGVFEVTGVPEDQIHPYLLIESKGENSAFDIYLYYSPYTQYIIIKFLLLPEINISNQK